MKPIHGSLTAVIVLVALATLLAAPPAAAQDEGTTRDDVLTSAFREVGEKAAPSVVKVVAAGQVLGHAVVVGEGRAVTSQRNVRGERRFTLVTSDGAQVGGRLAGWDGWLDVALITFDASERAIEPIRRGDAPSVGDWVVTVGTDRTPLGAGVVSAVDRDVARDRKNPGLGLGFMSPGHRTPMRAYEGVIQHDTPLEDGEMGCPLVDVEGRMVGLNVARPYRSTSFAVPVEAIDGVLDDLADGKRTEPPPDATPGDMPTNILGDPEGLRRQFDEQMGDGLGQLFEGLREMLEAMRREMEGEPAPRPPLEAPAPARPGWLGVDARTADRRGVEILELLGDSPAGEAGLEVGDVLVSIDGERIRNKDQLARRLRSLPAGTKVRFRYIRLDGAGDWIEDSVDVRLGERKKSF